MCYIFFFFFQAEDGIRDIGVTGVQTCALPILTLPRASDPSGWRRVACARESYHSSSGGLARSCLCILLLLIQKRSEERRVGKECRYRWSPLNQKKKKFI